MWCCAVSAPCLPLPAGSTLAGCLPTLLRSFNHMQLLAASASMSYAGLTGSYASAAQQLNWALLRNWLPARAAQAVDDQAARWAARVVTAPAADTGSWTPAPSNGSNIDDWLEGLQQSSALLAVYDISTVSSARQLEQLPLPSRVMQPQVPEMVVVGQDIGGPAFHAWHSMFWSLGVAAGMLVLATLVHIVIWALGSRTQRPRQGLTQPATIQLPLLLLVSLLLTMPAVVYWAGCLAGTGQTLWMVLVAMLGSCCPSAALYIWLLQHILGTAEDALLGPEDPEPLPASAATAAAGLLASQPGAAGLPGAMQVDVVQQYRGPVAEAVDSAGAAAAGRPDEAAAAIAADTGASAVHSPTEAEAVTTAALGGALMQAVSETMWSYQTRLHRFRQGPYLSVSSKQLTVAEQQQVNQQLTLQHNNQQQQEVSASGAAAAAFLRPSLSQPLGEANETDNRQLKYSSTGQGQLSAAATAESGQQRISVNGFFEDISDIVDVEELQRQQILQVSSA